MCSSDLIDLDLKNNAILDQAIDKALGFARNKAADVTTMETKNELVAMAAEYVLKGAPKAMKYLKIDPPQLAEAKKK